MSSEDATIRRGARNARYTAVPNHVFEDVRLSMEARWLLGYLLSKPDGWTVRLGDIRKKGGCGRDKARAMIGELVDTGYAEREPARKDGKFNGLSVVIYDEPQLPAQAESVASLPQPEKPATAEPATVLPGPVNPPLVKTEGLVTPESSEERERGREGEETEPTDVEPVSVDDPKKFEQRVKRLAGLGWPRWEKSSTDWTIGRFATLSDAERAEAELYAPAYLKRNGKGALSLGTYFVERKWRDLPADVLAPPEPAFVEAKPWGKLWQVWRLKLLLSGATGPAPRLTAFEQKQVESGAWDLRTLMREKLAKTGWPQVNDMHSRASHGGSISVSAALQPLGELMEAVRIGTERWLAWQREHDVRGWPWLPDPGSQEWVYFPVGGPERLMEFEMAVRGGHDGDRQQAAE